MKKNKILSIIASLLIPAISCASYTPNKQPFELSNVSIATSVASNALTIALKTKAGSDATGANPIGIAFRSATVTSGAFTRQLVKTALSTVISSGSTAGCSDGSDCYIYVYAINNSGTVELAWSGALYDPGSVHSTTAEGGTGDADDRETLYSTTARTGVPVRLLGRLNINQTTAGTYTANSTEVSIANSIGAFYPRNKFQVKYLSASTNTNGVISDLTFNNLVIGKRYRVGAQVYFVQANGSTLSLTCSHNGTTIAIQKHKNNEGTFWDNADYMSSAPFVATATTVTFTYAGATTSTNLVGNGTSALTWAVLEEIEDMVPSNGF